MDKIWYRNPLKLEVIGRCGGDGKTRMTTQNRQKLNAKKVSAAIKAIHYRCCRTTLYFRLTHVQYINTRSIQFFNIVFVL